MTGNACKLNKLLYNNVQLFFSLSLFITVHSGYEFGIAKLD
jgi:hypothetical protein